MCLLVILAFTLILVLRHWRAMLLIATVIVAVAILLKNTPLIQSSGRASPKDLHCGIVAVYVQSAVLRFPVTRRANSLGGNAGSNPAGDAKILTGFYSLNPKPVGCADETGKRYRA